MKVYFETKVLGVIEIPEEMESEVLANMKSVEPFCSDQLFQLLDSGGWRPVYKTSDHSHTENGKFFIENDEGEQIYGFTPKHLTLDADESGDVFLCQRFSVVQKLSLTPQHVKMWKEESGKNPDLTLDEFYHMIGGSSWHWDHDTQQEQVELKPYLSHE